MQQHETFTSLEDQGKTSFSAQAFNRRQRANQHETSESDVLLHTMLQLLDEAPIEQMPPEWQARYHSIQQQAHRLQQLPGEAQKRSLLLDAASLLLDCLEDDFPEPWVESRDDVIALGMPWLQEEEAARQQHAGRWEFSTLIQAFQREQARMEGLRNTLIVHLTSRAALHGSTPARSRGIRSGAFLPY